MSRLDNNLGPVTTDEFFFLVIFLQFFQPEFYFWAPSIWRILLGKMAQIPQISTHKKLSDFYDEFQ